MYRWLTLAQWAIVLATFVGSAVVWPAVPQRIAVHWSLNGQPDGFADKTQGLFLTPVLMVVVLVGLKLLPRIDPLRARYAEFEGAYAVVVLAIVAFLAAIQAMMVASALGARVNAGLVIAPLVGVLLIVLGAVMDRLRPNWFMGIRTPWTLSSERSWTATHRAGRYVFFAMGVAIALAGVAQTAWSFYFAMLVCLVGIVGLIAYSYVVWREDQQRHHPLGSQPR